jgi:hypothetical protein
VIASSSATAWADPVAPPNIPEPSANSENAQPEELPLPYEPWQAAGFQPPPSLANRDLPPPLARARQLPRRPFEISAGLGAFLPSCGSGSIDDRACLTVKPGSGLDLALLYRAVPFFAVGAEVALSGFAASGRGFASAAGGGARFFGVAGRVYFADSGAWDPYLALTLGAGSIDLRGAEPNGASVSTSGFGGRIGGGIDYVFGSHFRMGPTASFARWLAWHEERCGGDICRAEPALYGRVLGFASLGLRISASFGEVL